MRFDTSPQMEPVNFGIGTDLDVQNETRIQSKSASIWNRPDGLSILTLLPGSISELRSKGTVTESEA